MHDVFLFERPHRVAYHSSTGRTGIAYAGDNLMKKKTMVEDDEKKRKESREQQRQDKLLACKSFLDNNSLPSGGYLFRITFCSHCVENNHATVVPSLLLRSPKNNCWQSEYKRVDLF